MINNPVGLYIHIPFCVRKCNYCDFLSFPSTKEKMSQYLDDLVGEMSLWEHEITSVDTIFIGGGTPSILDISLLDKLFQGIHRYFTLSSKVEFSMECNPGTVDKEKLSFMRESGVNRLSFGLQSANDQELVTLGRIHNYKQFEQNFRHARQVGFDNINIDIMSGIPLQTRKSYEYTCETVLKLEPEHISAYSLIVEEGTPFWEQYRETPAVSEELDREMYHDTITKFMERGYARYEISNYAKEGYECKHNLKYWSREDYLGLGLGAASLLQNVRHDNVRDCSRFHEMIQNHKAPIEGQQILSVQEQMEEYMFLGLRKICGVSKQSFRDLFHQSIYDIYERPIKSMVEKKLLVDEKDALYLTEFGLDVSNTVMAQFLLDETE